MERNLLFVNMRKYVLQQISAHHPPPQGKVTNSHQEQILKIRFLQFFIVLKLLEFQVTNFDNNFQNLFAIIIRIHFLLKKSFQQQQFFIILKFFKFQLQVPNFYFHNNFPKLCPDIHNLKKNFEQQQFFIILEFFKFQFQVKLIFTLITTFQTYLL